MRKISVSLLITTLLSLSVSARDITPIDYQSEEVQKLRTYRQIRRFADRNIHRDDTCIDDYAIRKTELSKKLWKTPVKMVLGTVGGAVLGTLGGLATGAFVGAIDPVSGVGQAGLDLAGINLENTIVDLLVGGLEEELREELMEELGEDFTEEILAQAVEEARGEIFGEVVEMAAEDYGVDLSGAATMAVGGLAIGTAVVLAYNVTKMTILTIKVNKVKGLVKLIFHAKRGEGRKLKRVAKVVTRRVNRKLKKEGLDEVEVTQEKVAEILAKADEDGAFCDGSMRRWKSARRHKAKLRKRLARRSDVLRFLKKTVLAEYGL